MSLLGRAALLLALAGAVYVIVAALSSRRPGRRAWGESATRGVHAVFAFTTLAIVTMWAALLTDNFDLRNVAEYSSTTLAPAYKMTALWGSQAGSLLLWAWILTGFASVVVLVNRNRNRELMPVVMAVMMGIAVFFLGLLSFVTSPFETLAVAPAEGRGLNPLLQNFYMQIHPPLLYLGYVGLSVPFAFAMAALVTRRLDTAWISSIRRWTIVSWLFLGVGILLGAKWAYETLGWGGYWAWDPVENAAFMPWLVATAFLHSIMVQERRGMLKVWNMVLVILTFSLCLFGTFLTRSGIIASVHAFGESTLGPFFLAFIGLVLVGSVSLLITRLPLLRSQHSLESYLSREAIFLFNNLLLVGLAFAVFWGTMFPILSEAARGEKITVGQGYYDQVATPIGIALLVLTGVGPLIAWRKASAAQLRRRFVVPLLIAAIAAIPLLALTDLSQSYPAAATVIAGVFVTACMVGEFARGTRVRHALGGVS
ncbi:MAG TPA: cytochrome c biogenesis protein CcsA, partial [Vicinamibacteria bacterium]